MFLRAATAVFIAAIAVAGSADAAGNTQIMLFNQTPAASFSVRKNNVVVATAVAAPSGALVYQSNVTLGDRFEFLAGGADTQGPLPPTNVTVTETSFGCASLAWTRSSDPLVAGYRVYFGARSRSQGAYTDSLDAGNTAGAQRCGFAAGNYYFAVRSYTGAGARSGFSKEVVLNARGTDTVAPSITQRSPAPGAANVSRSTSVYFVATDDKSGVNAASIAVLVNGVSCAFTTSTAAGGFAVQCDPAGDLPADSDVQVVLSIADLGSPANVAQPSYSFHTGTSSVTDTDPPSIAAVTPSANAAGADLRPTIDVRVNDAGLGVELSSLTMTVNGAAVVFSVEGDPASTHMRYRPARDFAAESTVRVHIDACDRAQPPQCAALDYEFDVRGANAALAGHGAIVPDGYWANDPARPLEIRDLPAHWGIHIFDTSGATVRHHVNQSDGTTWTWNFTNDNGERVAPALYLVRVTDNGGAVQRSGRFLVQSQR